ncbi:MAG: hypothetical protein ABI333_25785 [bacterium]
MWTGTIPFETLAADGRWKVELWSCEAGTVEAGYPLVRLGELVGEVRQTVDPQAEPERLLCYVGLEHIESGTGDLVGYEPRLGRAVRSRSKVFGAGNVLFGRLRPLLNKVYLACDEQVAEGICSGELLVLVPDRSRVLPRVLRYLLASPYVQGHIARFQTGAALPRVSAADLLSLKLPVPPLADQRVLEETLRRADLDRRRLRAELQGHPEETMNRFVQSLRRGEP